ncbi:extracellular solute-binding protein [Dictyobacter arantiisoli]|uniref:Sugar ABC transporter substrate-binding protein n=1 Tax=Dictyobacter arantiisoli TaxID=2014874 RepID=A0A5A5TIS1_9CHLR|nr:extracellular solute-binding protein [Dictyobacter arantiisoli]GCF11108.1 sugar ABC transporter substrate-binding protein [Dictyobacter arantiisoli]
MTNLSQRCVFASLFCAMLLLLTGCQLPFLAASEAGLHADKVTVTLWYWNRSLDDNLLAQVGRRFPQINFRALKIGGSYDTRLRTALAGQANIPDLVGMNANIASYFPDENQFVDLRTLGATALQAGYLPWKWRQAVAPDQRVIALPMDTGPIALFYRTDLFRQAGLPTDPAAVAAHLKSWDDYIRAGIQMKQATQGAIHLFDNINAVFNQIMAQSPMQYFAAPDRYIGDQSQVRRAWDYAARIHQLDLSAKATSYSTDWSAALSSGSVASFVGGVWLKRRLFDSASNTAGKWRIAPAPGGPGNSGGSFLAVTKASQHPQQAFEIAKWLLSAQNQSISYRDNGLYPSALASLSSPTLAQPEPFFGGQVTTHIFSQIAKHIQPVYTNSQSDVVQNVLQRGLTSIEMQNADPQSAWQDAQQQIQRELSH